MKSSILHLTLASIGCAAAIVGYVFWYGAVSAKSAEVTALQSKIDANIASVNRMASTRAALAEVEGDETIVQSYFVPETGVVSFIDSLQARGQALGADVSVLSVSTQRLSEQQALVLSLSIRGAFDAVMRTIGSIEYAPYDITFSTLAVGQDGKNSWHADLKLVAGSLPAKAATSTP